LDTNHESTFETWIQIQIWSWTLLQGRIRIRNKQFQIPNTPLYPYRKRVSTKTNKAWAKHIVSLLQLQT
jgi:hypothetical protein